MLVNLLTFCVLASEKEMLDTTDELVFIKKFIGGSKVDNLGKARSCSSEPWQNSSDNLFCWGLYMGRTWIVTYTSPRKLAIYSNGSTSAGNETEFSLWQLLTIEAGSENLSAVCSSVEWCTPPYPEIGDRVLNSNDNYCASFACAFGSRIFVYHPQNRTDGDIIWELVSILKADGVVNSISWAPSGHHILSGGSNIILWTPVTQNNRACNDHLKQLNKGRIETEGKDTEL